MLNRNHPDTILIGISQTGKSTGTIDCIKMANNHNIKTIALSEATDSPLAEIANHVITMGCGNEDVPPKTKGFSATVLTLQLLILSLLQKEDNELLTEYKKILRLLKRPLQILRIGLKIMDIGLKHLLLLLLVLVIMMVLLKKEH